MNRSIFQATWWMPTGRRPALVEPRPIRLGNPHRRMPASAMNGRRVLATRPQAWRMQCRRGISARKWLLAKPFRPHLMQALICFRVSSRAQQTSPATPERKLRPSQGNQRQMVMVSRCITASASMAWAQRWLEWRCTAASCRSVERSSCSSTTCAHQFVLLPCLERQWSSSSPTTLSPLAKMGQRISRLSNSLDFARCQTCMSFDLPMPTRPLLRGLTPSPTTAQPLWCSAARTFVS